MQLDDYFDFLGPLDIRVNGTRIGIETILWDYLDKGLFAEEIASRYRSLTLEQVYATLTYYWHNQEQLDAYKRAVEEELARQRREQDLNPSPAILRLRALAAERRAAQATQK